MTDGTSGSTSWRGQAVHPTIAMWFDQMTSTRILPILEAALENSSHIDVTLTVAGSASARPPAVSIKCSRYNGEDPR